MTDAPNSDGALRVPLNAFTMQLRPSELESVAAGLDYADPLSLVEAVRRLAVNDRAATWELAIRHLGRHTPLPEAAGEIGMDLVHARDLLEAFRNL
ncbi:MAG TPA: hypothetical protein VKV73_21420 [Chloroflexota bacterium]|nr:hypothetical protein [Chloroflexota bacterium]